MGWKKRAGVAAVAVLSGIGLWLLTPGTIGNYLVGAGLGQAEMLRLRVPHDEAIASGVLTPREIESLKRVGPIKEFGRSIGLSATRNYDTISLGWDHTIWNVSACHPTAFRPATWWFPIVGRVPYLGYFDIAVARTQARRMRARGLDVQVRTAGAYSTLGWFEDPVLPGMLKWDESRLANTLLHELAHATVWIPGSVQFNESFASFVGDVAGERYLAETYGADSAALRKEQQRDEDRARFRQLLHEVYGELDDVYKNSELPRDEKLRRKHRTLAQIPVRVARLGLHDHKKYVSWSQRTPWNNARLLQFRTYNRSHEWFALLLEKHDGDLPGFMNAVAEVTAGADDPYKALALAVGASPEADRGH